MRRALAIALRLAAFALACGLSWFAFVNYMFARGINRSYFHSDHVPLSATDFVFIAFVAYLFVAAITGRAIPWRRRRA